MIESSGLTEWKRLRKLSGKYESDSAGNGSGWERKRESLEDVVSYSRKLEARVNFYVEAVSGYDDTTDCSVQWVVYCSTIR